MIRSLENTAPRALRFLGESLQRVENKLKRPGYIPGISTVTGSLEVLVGTTVAISAATSWLFYSARLKVPVLFKSQKVIWAKSGAVNSSLQVLMDSVKMIGLGVLTAIPVVGNASAFCIYTLIEQKRALERGGVDFSKELADLKQKLSETTAELSTLHASFESKDKELISAKKEVEKLNIALKPYLEGNFPEKNDLLGKIESKEKEIIIAKNDIQKAERALDEIRKELGELQSKSSADQAILRKEIDQKLTELRGKELEIEQHKKKYEALHTDFDQLNISFSEFKKKAENEASRLQEKFAKAQETVAKRNAQLRSEKDKVDTLEKENAELKERLANLQSDQRKVELQLSNAEARLKVKASKP